MNSFLFRFEIQNSRRCNWHRGAFGRIEAREQLSHSITFQLKVDEPNFTAFSQLHLNGHALWPEKLERNLPCTQQDSNPRRKGFCSAGVCSNSELQPLRVDEPKLVNYSDNVTFLVKYFTSAHRFVKSFPLKVFSQRQLISKLASSLIPLFTFPTFFAPPIIFRDFSGWFDDSRRQTKSSDKNRDPNDGSSFFKWFPKSMDLLFHQTKVHLWRCGDVLK